MLGWFALCAGVSRAATPVALPPTEDAAAWSNALALADLVPASPGTAAPITVVAEAERWRLVVRGPGGEHTVDVAVPKTRADREAIGALAASLLRSVVMPEVALPALPEASPPQATEPTYEAPVAVLPGEDRLGKLGWSPPVLAPLAPHPRTLAPRPTALPESPRAIAPADLDAIDTSAVYGWAGLGPVLRMRPTVRTTPAIAVWGGVGMDPPVPALGVGARLPVRLGAVVEGVLPSEVLPTEDAGVRFGGVELRVLAAWAPGRWALGPTFGASLRTFPYPFGPAKFSTAPVAGGFVAYHVPVGPIAVRIGLCLDADLRRTTFTPITGGIAGATTELQPVSVGLGVGLATADPRSERTVATGGADPRTAD